MCLGIGLMGCEKDKMIYPEIEETPQASAKVVESSLPEGSVIKAEDVDQIWLTYDGQISVNPSSCVTLNGMRAYAAVQDKKLVVNVDLEPGTAYTLEVPADAVIANKGFAYAEAYKLTFVTEKGSAESGYLATLSNPNATAQAKKVLNWRGCDVREVAKKAADNGYLAIANPKDGFQMTLTDLGREVVQKRLAAEDKAADAVLSGLSAAEKKKLMELCDKISATAEEMGVDYARIQKKHGRACGKKRERDGKRCCKHGHGHGGPKYVFVFKEGEGGANGCCHEH